VTSIPFHHHGHPIQPNVHLRDKARSQFPNFLTGDAVNRENSPARFGKAERDGRALEKGGFSGFPAVRLCPRGMGTSPEISFAA